MFYEYSANINNTLRFVRANVSQQMFPSLPTVGYMAKHRQETMFPQQSVLICPGLYTCPDFDGALLNFTFFSEIGGPRVSSLGDLGRLPPPPPHVALLFRQPDRMHIKLSMY